MLPCALLGCLAASRPRTRMPQRRAVQAVWLLLPVIGGAGLFLRALAMP